MARKVEQFPDCVALHSLIFDIGLAIFVPAALGRALLASIALVLCEVTRSGEGLKEDLDRFGLPFGCLGQVIFIVDNLLFDEMFSESSFASVSGGAAWKRARKSIFFGVFHENLT